MIIFTGDTLVRDVALAIVVLFFGFSFQFATIFFYKWCKQPVRRLVDSNFLWALLLIFLNFQQLFFVINDFYVYDSLSLVWIYLGYISIGAGIIIFILLQESSLPFNSHYVFTITSVLLFTLLLVAPRDVQIFMVVPEGAILVIEFLIFIQYVIKVSSTQEKKQFVLFVVGVVFLAIGEGLKSEFITNIHIVFYIMGAGFMLIGIVVSNYALLKLPGFTEIGWSKVIREIFVIHRSGTPILHAKFENGRIKRDPMDSKTLLTSGIITAMQTAISEVLESKSKTMSFDKGDYKILLRKNKNALVVVFSEKNYATIHNKMQQFIKDFCKLFKNELENKPKDVSIFNIGYSLIEEIFKEE